MPQGISYLFVHLHKLDVSAAVELQETQGKMTRLQTHVLNFTVQFLDMEDSPVSLVHPPASRAYAVQQFIFINRPTHIFTD